MCGGSVFSRLFDDLMSGWDDGNFVTAHFFCLMWLNIFLWGLLLLWIEVMVYVKKTEDACRM